MRRHASVDGGYDGRPAFAGIRYPAREARERRIIDQRCCREVEQRGGDHAAAVPDFRDVGQVQIVLIMFGIAQRACRPGWTVPRPKSDCAPAKLSTNSRVWSSRVDWAMAIDMVALQ
jgi:hypothetical protein